MRSWSHESVNAARKIIIDPLSVRKLIFLNFGFRFKFDSALLEVTSRIFEFDFLDFRLSALIFHSLVIRDNSGSEFLSLLYYRYGKIFFFFYELELWFLLFFNTWNEHWKLIATMIYILYTWKISIIYIIVISLSLCLNAIYIETKNNLLSSESRRDLTHDSVDDSICETASILSDTWYDSTFERLP